MNINEFFHSTIASDVAADGGTGFPICFKCTIICAYDMRKEFEWDEIDGVRRVTEIRFYSDATNALYNSNFFVRRVFSYNATSPRDLNEITDTLVAL